MKHHESYQEVGELEKRVEQLEEDIFVALSQGPITPDVKDDLLSRIAMMTSELQQHDEPLLNEGCVETLNQLKEDVLEHPMKGIQIEEEEAADRIRAGESQE